MTPRDTRGSPPATLSLDLDNDWAYLKTHSDPRWKEWPSFLSLVVPRILEVLREIPLKITFFVVGQDARFPENGELLRSIAADGHEIGNHSLLHEPWLASSPESEIADEIASAEDAILAATGIRPRGFRGPGHAISPTIIRILHARGYEYDASCWPTVVTPLLRMWYFRQARLSAEERHRRRNMGGSWRECFRSLRPHSWNVGGARLLELPVTTLPLLRTPIHLTYLHALATRSEWLAMRYFDTALTLCRLRGVPPSLLLHATDFLGRDDGIHLDFLPGINRPTRDRVEFTRRIVLRLANRFEILDLLTFARRLNSLLPNSPAPNSRTADTQTPETGKPPK